jgi:phage tail sheath protein FI
MAFLSPGIYVQEMPSAVKPIAGASTSTAAFVSIIPDVVQLLAKGDTTPTKLVDFTSTVAGKTALLITSWSQFTAAFGDLIGSQATAASTAAGAALNVNQQHLAQAVYGYFNNGGSRAYVVRAASMTDLAAALAALEPIDEISLVLAPGLTDNTIRAAVVAHCAHAGGRFAILDAPDQTKDLAQLSLPSRSDLAAIYTPWLKVFDPATALANPTGNGTASVPPGGHLAGIYARVDNDRGVHKAPANETVLGAVDLSMALSRADQDGLNPKGINCIRRLNGSILVWGARTAGGDDNADLKYISVRRTLIFLEQSIRNGTQWVVFEPNTAALWQKINRNITAFLTQVWRSGALFGDTAAEAFYVKCDADNNPPAQRDLGQVVTEVGVAIARPAEFVVFQISQWAGPTS